MFKCEHCGCCCRHLNMNKMYASLDRGDGICKYLKGNDCTIYEHRPLLCQIDKSYDYFFSNVMTREEYYQLNKRVCKKLRELEE